MTRVTDIHCVHYIEQKDCKAVLVRGRGYNVYERFLLQKLIRYTPATQARLYRGGPLYQYFIHRIINDRIEKSIKGRQNCH